MALQPEPSQQSIQSAVGDELHVVIKKQARGRVLLSCTENG
jgi:hypothetical protein